MKWAAFQDPMKTSQKSDESIAAKAKRTLGEIRVRPISLRMLSGVVLMPMMSRAAGIGWPRGERTRSGGRKKMYAKRQAATWMAAQAARTPYETPANEFLLMLAPKAMADPIVLPSASPTHLEESRRVDQDALGKLLE